MRTAQIRSPYARGEAVHAIVSRRDGLRLVVERSDVTYRAKDFFFHATRGFSKAGPNRRFNEEAVVAGIAKVWHTAACYNARTFSDRKCVIIQYFRAVLRRNERTKRCFGCLRP